MRQVYQYDQCQQSSEWRSVVYEIWQAREEWKAQQVVGVRIYQAMLSIDSVLSGAAHRRMKRVDPCPKYQDPYYVSSNKHVLFGFN